MGRHSAPGSDEDELSAAAPLAADPLEELIPWGRHEIVDAATINDTAVINGAEPPAVAGPAVESAPSAAAPVESAPARPARPAAERSSAGTRGDLQLLRENHALRVRCAAAVLVPFALYTAILVALGRTDVYLIWLWIPTVLAGVSVGAFLDIAHRRRRPAPTVEPAPGEPASIKPAPADSVDDD